MWYVDRESCNNCNYLSFSKKIRFKRIRGRIFSQRKMTKSTNSVGVTRITNSKPYATIQPLSRRSFIEFNWTYLVAKLARSNEHYSILSRKRVKNEHPFGVIRRNNLFFAFCRSIMRIFLSIRHTLANENEKFHCQTRRLFLNRSLDNIIPDWIIIVSMLEPSHFSARLIQNTAKKTLVWFFILIFICEFLTISLKHK